jgi:hypothetical protein
VARLRRLTSPNLVPWRDGRYLLVLSDKEGWPLTCAQNANVAVNVLLTDPISTDAYPGAREGVWSSERLWFWISLGHLFAFELNSKHQVAAFSIPSFPSRPADLYPQNRALGNRMWLGFLSWARFKKSTSLLAIADRLIESVSPCAMVTAGEFHTHTSVRPCKSLRRSD